MTACWKPMLLVLCASTVCALTPDAKGADEPAAWKWREGESIFYHYSEDNLTMMSGSKKASEENRLQIHFGVQIDSRWRTVSALTAEHDARLEVIIERMRLYSPSVCYDSKFAELNRSQHTADAIASVFDPLIGKKWHFTSDARGRFRFIDGPESLAAVFGTNEAQELKGYYGGLFSSAGLKERLVIQGVELPAAAPAKGVSWETSQTIETPMKDQFTISDMAAADGKRELTATIELKLRDKSPQMTLKEGWGKCGFDLDSGKLDYLKQTCELSISTPWDVKGLHIITMEVNRLPEVEAKTQEHASQGK